MLGNEPRDVILAPTQVRDAYEPVYGAFDGLLVEVLEAQISKQTMPDPVHRFG
jgi:hypothetical protein